MLKQVFGPKRIHSQVIKPLSHRGIYNYRDYVRIIQAEEQAEETGEEEMSLYFRLFFYIWEQRNTAGHWRS
jgi:hypothetical protein